MKDKGKDYDVHDTIEQKQKPTRQTQANKHTHTRH